MELLRAYFQIEAGDGVRKITEKVTGKLLSLDRTLEAVIPPLLWLLDVAVDDESWARLDAAQRRRQTLDGVKRLLLRESQAQPLIVVFEDLHWIDPETQALLDSLVESLPTARMLLLVNYRPEYQHAWSSKTYYRLLRIDPLPQIGAEALLEVLLGPDVEPSPAQGPPGCADRGQPVLPRGKRPNARRDEDPGRGARGLSTDESARRLQPDAADSRHRPRPARRAHRSAAPGGQAPAAGRVGHRHRRSIRSPPGHHGRGRPRLRQGLTRLQAAEFLYETRLFPELEYTFKHALTHEVTYGTLLHERRRALHARIVEAIEHLYADRLTEQAERLAHHAVKGELRDKALHYLRQAGMKASARSALQDARVWFEQALGVLEALPESRPRWSRPSRPAWISGRC